MIKYLKQPEESKQCGQYSLAMAIGKTVDEICSVINKKSSTHNTDIYKALNHYGIEYKWSRCSKSKPIPDNSIVKIGFEGFKSTHFTYFKNNTFYDPFFGIAEDYSSNPIRVEFISYIQLSPSIK